MNGDRKLYDFQLTGIEWLKNKHRCILADDCGLGKTAMSLLSSKHDAILAVVPCSVKINWANEVKIWTPHLKPIVCNGLNSFKWPDHGEVIICNSELIPDFCHEPSTPVSIILDEVHQYRNSRPTKYRNMKYCIHRAGYESTVVGMTGTVIVNRITDLANIVDLIGLMDHFGGKQGFAELLSTKYGKRGDIRNPTISETFSNKLMHIALRRTKEDVLDDLPEKVYSVHHINEWSGELDTVMNNGLSSLEAFEKLNGPIADGVLPPLTELAKARHDMAKSKIPHTEPLVRSILENNEQVLVYSAHKSPVEHFGAMPDWGIINGSISATKRQKASNDLKDGRIKAIAATIGAGNCGINLQSCRNTVFVDLSYQLAENLQCQDRTCRIGQKSTHVHYHFISYDHPLDRRLGALLSGKQKLFNSVLDPITIRN